MRQGIQQRVPEQTAFCWQGTQEETSGCLEQRQRSSRQRRFAKAYCFYNSSIDDRHPEIDAGQHPLVLLFCLILYILRSGLWKRKDIEVEEDGMWPGCTVVVAILVWSAKMHLFILQNGLILVLYSV